MVRKKDLCLLSSERIYLGRSGVPLLAGHHADPRALIALLPGAPLRARRAAGRALLPGFPGAAVPVFGGRFHVACCDPQILSTRNSHIGSSISSGGSKGGARDAPRGAQILSISCSFWENMAKSYVGTPRGVGAPFSGKSWIRH